NTVSVFLREPLAGARLARFTFASMQDLSLDYIGNYAAGDPRDASRLCRDGDPALLASSRAFERDLPWNAWSEIKYHVFPRGLGLVVSLALLLVVFEGLRRRGPASARAMASAGMLLIAACVVDMLVAVAGDGRYELIKHLFL